MKFTWHAGYWILLVLAAAVIYVNVGDRGTLTRRLDLAAKSITQESETIFRKDRVIDSLKLVQHHLDSLDVVQHHAFARSDSTYRAAGTITVHDTVWVPKTVADVAIQGCSLVLTTCEMRAAVAEERADSARVAEDSAKAMAKQLKTLADGAVVQANKQKWRWGINGFGAGALACYLSPLFHGR